MKDSEFFLLKAKSFITATELILNTVTDEYTITTAGYFIQQAFELAIKAQLAKYTLDFPYKHELELLYKFIKDNNYNIITTDWLDRNYYMLDKWEAKGRYVNGYLIEANKIKEATTEAHKLVTLIENTDNIVDDLLDTFCKIENLDTDSFLRKYNYLKGTNITELYTFGNTDKARAIIAYTRDKNIDISNYRK